MRRCAGSAAEVGKHGEHAPVVVVGGLQAQLEEDGRGVLGDGALGDHEPLGGWVPWSRYVPASGSRCRRSDPRNPAVAIPAGQRHLLAGPCQVGGGPHGDGQVQPGSRRPPAADGSMLSAVAVRRVSPVTSAACPSSLNSATGRYSGPTHSEHTGSGMSVL
jgi:hypothetical protein